MTNWWFPFLDGNGRNVWKFPFRDINGKKRRRFPITDAMIAQSGPVLRADANFAEAEYIIVGDLTIYTASDFFGADEEPGTTWDAADVIAGEGLRGDQNHLTDPPLPSIIGPLLTAILRDGGSTIVADYVLDEIPLPTNVVWGLDAFNSPAWSFDLAAILETQGGPPANSLFLTLEAIPTTSNNGGGSSIITGPAVSRVAFNFVGENQAISSNGEAIFSIAGDIDQAALNKIYFRGNGYHRLKRIRVYDVVSAALLPTLSAV